MSWYILIGPIAVVVWLVIIVVVAILEEDW